MNNKIPVAFYARVSSEEQAKGDSVEHQFMMLEEALARMPDSDQYFTDSTLWYKDEGISAYSTLLNDRKDMHRLLQDAKTSKIGMVMVKHSNRIARDGEEISKIPNILEQHGVRLKIVLGGGYDSNNPESKIFLTLGGVMDQKFSDDLSINMSTSLRNKVRKGQWAAIQSPMGYVVDKTTKKLVVDEQSAQAVRNIFHWYVHERIGTQKISERMNSKGFKTARGNDFDKSHILNTLSNMAYIGHTVYGKTRNKLVRVYDDKNNQSGKKKVHAKANDPITMENTHEPIIDEFTFWKAQEIMNKRATNNSHKTKAKYPLVGIVKCARCGSNMVCQQRKGNNFRYYKCCKQFRFGRESCDAVGIRGQTLEQFLLQELLQRLEAYIAKAHIPSAQGKNDDSHLLDRMKELETRQKKLVQNQVEMTLEKELYTEESFKEVMKQIKQKIELIDEQMNITYRQLEEVQKQETHKTYANDLLDQSKKIDPENITELRSLFHDLIEHVQVHDNDTITSIKFRYNFL
ncbi:recombinase family protein [Tumebacillus permanentifrigoris]|uniref:DNA invertase Pin-like site-specific DNA recombinase n=1 Tax=Tumebacillus permanentifrigoris TaxID=378543 RepID=A0A316D9Q8_9BACL|nr:recombinase family protein [Tumebacillus permanentifrigoris]PWK08468.1 DNA invertase Pin-like site-specific DNA recombinase [Tumebacillus permanentifrigoris]